MYAEQHSAAVFFPLVTPDDFPPLFGFQFGTPATCNRAQKAELKRIFCSISPQTPAMAASGADRSG
jgi:hypothetical protein